MSDTDSSSSEPPSRREKVCGCANSRSVEVFDPSGLLSAASVRWLTDRALAAMIELGASGEVRARATPRREMAAAHERYSGIPGATDVLTFDLRDTGTGDAEEGCAAPLDVDIWVCVDVAREHAEEHGHSVERELLLYIVHGMLHCLGHDDHDEAAHAAMHAEEDRVLEAIGVGATFGAVEREDARGDAA